MLGAAWQPGGGANPQEGLFRKLTLSHERIFVILALATATMIAASNAFAQTCLRPKWTECISFPNGGRHTGTSPQGTPVRMEVPPGPDICVSNEWEIRAETYAQFARNGVPWPNRDWEVRVEDFCFYRN